MAARPGRFEGTRPAVRKEETQPRGSMTQPPQNLKFAKSQEQVICSGQKSTFDHFWPSRIKSLAGGRKRNRGSFLAELLCVEEETASAAGNPAGGGTLRRGALASETLTPPEGSSQLPSKIRDGGCVELDAAPIGRAGRGVRDRRGAERLLRSRRRQGTPAGRCEMAGGIPQRSTSHAQ